MMKKFFIRSILFTLLCITGFMSVFMLADGGTNSSYIKFTTPKQHSLIVGNSRSLWGLKPHVMNEYLSLENEKGIYNFSFNLSESPYGPDYASLIQRKIKPGVDDGLYIVTVDPWSISSYGEDPNDINNFREKDHFINNMPIVNMKPNLFYLLFNFDGTYKDIITRRLNPTGTYVHDNGWMEVNMERSTIPPKERIEEHAKFYREVFATEKSFSHVRLNSLSQLTKHLQRHGTVFLVRLPVHQAMFEVEDMYMPDFDEKMDSIATKYGVAYINFKNFENKYEFFDSGHLTVNGAYQLSKDLAELIKSN